MESTLIRSRSYPYHSSTRRSRDALSSEEEALVSRDDLFHFCIHQTCQRLQEKVPKPTKMCTRVYYHFRCGCKKLRNTVPCRLLWLGKDCESKTDDVSLPSACEWWGCPIPIMEAMREMKKRKQKKKKRCHALARLSRHSRLSEIVTKGFVS